MGLDLYLFPEKGKSGTCLENFEAFYGTFVKKTCL